MNSDEQIQDIASRVIKGWRTRKKMSQSTLAEKLGMHQTAIAKIESGERRIDFATVVKISDVLGIPWDEFNISSPTENEVVIQHFSKFVIIAEKWMSNVKAANSAVHETQPVIEDVLTYVAPARLVETKTVTAESFQSATKALNHVHKVMLESLDYELQKKLVVVEDMLSIINEFIHNLEQAQEDAES
jgi:transcriptional regulator with XRE-family HTH domain